MDMLLAVILTSSAIVLGAGQSPGGRIEADVGRYMPVDGGWHIRVPNVAPAAGLEPRAGIVPDADIGVVQDDARLHRRPLFPPAEKALIWKEEELAQIPRCTFRPIVLAYNEPRFLFDYHSAGGLLGHLFIGLTRAAPGADAGASKWFHQWADVEVSYVDGRMEYVLHDPAFPGITVSLAAIPLADAVGLLVKVGVEGPLDKASLTWAYGGASAFFTNYAMTAPEFTFAPGQCAKDVVGPSSGSAPPSVQSRTDPGGRAGVRPYDTWGDGGFTLRRAFDKDDIVTKEAFSVFPSLPTWQAVIRGGSSWKGRAGYGEPSAFPTSPLELVEKTVWNAPAPEQRNCVAVQDIALAEGARQGYIVVGMGGGIAADINDPAKAWEAALARNRSIAERVVTQTPDPYLDAAARMMAFCTEGTWGAEAIVHGGWSWRFAYLGWRTWYGPDCYGWTDRIRKCIENHTTLGLVRDGEDAGALGSMLEGGPGVYYNMNEVFMDHVRHYFDYTNDLELMGRIFPLLEGILAWENRRLQPENAYLYENALNTWISDSHWYIGGQCTQASAYMLRAHAFLADLAKRLGKDPTPYKDRAKRIRAAMQQKLWLSDQGVFAEYLDTRGHRLLHTEPELPTIYHSAEFGAADETQIRRMLAWADAHLRTETTPNGGKLVWSSNWFPNRGRSYTHSTYEMAYGEELNYALTNYLGGRADDAYAIIRATLCGIFNGPTPGGLSCHSYVDGRQRANDEFADASSMWCRALTEGLFGIVPKRPDGVVELKPQFPSDWNEASISTPHFSYTWQRTAKGVTVTWRSPVATAVRLALASPIRETTATVDGQPAVIHPELRFTGLKAMGVETRSQTSGTITLTYPLTKAAVEPPALAAPSVHKVWSRPDAGDHDLSRWTLIDLGKTFNAPVTEVLKQVLDKAVAPALPASQIGFGYWKDHLLTYHGSRNQPISDAAWRTKVGADGVAWTTDGIPFKTAKEGPNIGVVSLTGAFTPSLEFLAQSAGKTLYLMISGMTFPAQSHVVNLRVTLRYADGKEEATDLVNASSVDDQLSWLVSGRPSRDGSSTRSIGDCWSTWCGRFHDTAANGFENIGGRTGPAGSAEVADLTKPVELDTEAQLVAFELRRGVELRSVAIEAIANDVVFGVMGATILN